MSDATGSHNSSPVRRSGCAAHSKPHHFVQERTPSRADASANMVCDNGYNAKTVGMLNFDEGVCLTSTPTHGRSSRCSSQSASTTASDTVSTPDTENGLSDYGLPESVDSYSRLSNDTTKPEYNIPIVGYEVMEERARFTVFRIHVENTRTRQSWFVFRRYTDFVRLNRKLKALFPGLRFALPPKRWFGNNFDPLFLEDRLLGLQAFINNIISHKDICHSEPVRTFFCLDEPPDPHDSIEESRALCESLEDTVHRLQEELKEKDSQLQLLLAEVAMLRSQQEALLKSLKLECSLAAHVLSPKLPSSSHPCSKDQDNSLTDASHNLTEITKNPVPDSHIFHMHSLNLALAHMVERSLADAQSASTSGERCSVSHESTHSTKSTKSKSDSRDSSCSHTKSSTMNSSCASASSRSSIDTCINVGARPSPIGSAGNSAHKEMIATSDSLNCSQQNGANGTVDLKPTRPDVTNPVPNHSVHSN